MNLDDAPKFQAYRQRKTSRLERFMVGCEKLITLWVACSIALFVVLVIAAQVYQTLWLPAGLSDPALVQVVGNSRALTRDGRVFEMSSNRWKPVDLPSGEAPVVWGLGREGWLVIASGEELLAFSSRYKLPKLAGPVLAVGLVHVCPTDGHSPWTDTLFAVSETQLAVEIGGEKAWMVVSLPSPASAPVVSSNCKLAWRTPAGAEPSGARP